MVATPNEPVLLRRDDGPVAILTLNRPHAMNALSGELIDALQAEFDKLARDKSIRCVIIEAKGRAFSTGHDLREVASSRDYAVHHDLLTRCSAGWDLRRWQWPSRPTSISISCASPSRAICWARQGC